TALIGVESFSEEGLKSANKQWNPAGQAMVDTIQRIQEHGILVLSSIICGLESDTVQTIRAMSTFARESGTILAQFTIYSAYPGTKDYHEMISDRNNRGKSAFVPKHRTQILYDRHWLSPKKPVYLIKHANMSSDELLAENKKCWDSFYSISEILRRVRSGPAKSWPIAGKIAYFCLCIVFKRVYSGHGVSADNVQRKRGIVTKALIKFGVGVYSHFFRQRKVELDVSVITPNDNKHSAALGTGRMRDPSSLACRFRITVTYSQRPRRAAPPEQSRPRTPTGSSIDRTQARFPPRTPTGSPIDRTQAIFPPRTPTGSPIDRTRSILPCPEPNARQRCRCVL